MRTMMEILDGKKTAAALSAELKAEVDALVARGERPPKLVAVMVGNNPASETYVRNKEKKCAELGFLSEVRRFATDVSEERLLQEVDAINDDATIDGVIVQLPLPKHINEQHVTHRIAPRKDVDGFHPVSLGRMLLGLPCYLPATPFGIVKLLAYYKIPTRGKHVVVLGRSHIVGLPIANMLLQKGEPGDCTVTVCHSRTENLAEVLHTADILIAAVGKADFVKKDMVKDGVIVIDVGINRVETTTNEKGWELRGDVAYEEVAPKCSYITPVPGGVGPMTILSLMLNTMQARKGGVE
ncbi:MAG: bifunctional 5,10-methylenetetrahydrofolate dehydrogenase/5,10-methenyltetrahydrofolate cyclohydrolase [Bacteroides sp.]